MEVIRPGGERAFPELSRVTHPPPGIGLDDPRYRRLVHRCHTSGAYDTSDLIRQRGGVCRLRTSVPCGSFDS